MASETFQRHVPAGAFVARMGQPVEHWTGIIDGLVKMSVTSSNGKVSTLTGLGAGGWYGEGSLLKRESRRYDVVALRPSRVAMLPHTTFDWLRATSLPFNHHLQFLMNARLSLFIGMLEYGRLLSTDARVARCLATLFNTDIYPHPRAYVDLHQQEIALAVRRVASARQRGAEGPARMRPRESRAAWPDGARSGRAATVRRRRDLKPQRLLTPDATWPAGTCSDAESTWPV